MKLTQSATLPSKANGTGSPSLNFQDAAFDLFPAIDTTLIPGERALIPTGLACIIPCGFWIKFYERSGLASKSGIHIMGGVIDNTYLGEWKVVMYNSSATTLNITTNKAICQFIVEKLQWSNISEISKEDFDMEFALRSDLRKNNGFGSTDKV